VASAAYEVRYTALATFELTEAYGWYLEREPAAAIGLMQEVSRAETFLQRNPHLYQRIDPGIRHLVLRRYPYALIYTVLETPADGWGTVLVLGCFHSSRQPVTQAEFEARMRG
jgi:plasmid stabilization system protein ParE